MEQWYVIRVTPNQEHIVKKAIEENLERKGMRDQIFEVLLPVENLSEVKNGQQHILEKKLWPGYILIQMDLNDESWQYVKSINGVINFVGGNKPISLPKKEIEDILSDLEDKKETVTQKHKFEVGDRVKIVAGVFYNLVGTIIDVFHEKGQVSVMVSIFGRDTRVDDLEFHEVEEESSEGTDEV